MSRVAPLPRTSSKSWRSSASFRAMAPLLSVETTFRGRGPRLLVGYQSLALALTGKRPAYNKYPSRRKHNSAGENKTFASVPVPPATVSATMADDGKIDVALPQDCDSAY